MTFKHARIKSTATALLVGLLMPILFTPFTTSAATTSLEVSGWLPYWRVASSTNSASAHLDHFKEINPFGFTVKSDGSLNDAMGLTDPKWQALFKDARAKKIRVVPTVTWGSGEAIHSILSDKKKRLAHINYIQQAVRVNGFDGIDINYEGKLAETKPYFSLFLKELYAAMGNKWVMCTIEARTPAEDRFSVVPTNLEFANDFKEINKYCDRVRIMAYDQSSIDLKLEKLHEKEPYAAVADSRWVEKVITLAAKDISKKKLVIGVPTYGYAYDLLPQPDGTYKYSKLWSFNPGYALGIAQKVGATPARTVSGEMGFTYPASSEPDPSSAIPFPNATRVMWWSDGQAVADKFALAERLGVRGIAIFKVDGGEDPNIWNLLPTQKR